MEERMLVLESALDRLERKFHQREKWCEILNLWILQQFDYDIQNYWLDLIANANSDGDGEEESMREGNAEERNHGQHDSRLVQGMEIEGDESILDNEGFYTELPITIHYDQEEEDSRERQAQDPLEYLQRIEEMDDEMQDSDCEVNKKYNVNMVQVQCTTSLDNGKKDVQRQDAEAGSDENDNDELASEKCRETVEDRERERSVERRMDEREKRSVTSVTTSGTGYEDAGSILAPSEASSSTTLEHLLSMPPQQIHSEKDIDAIMHRLDSSNGTKTMTILAHERRSENSSQNETNAPNVNISQPLYSQNACGPNTSSNQSQNQNQDQSYDQNQNQNKNNQTNLEGENRNGIQNVVDQLQIVQSPPNFQSSNFLPYPITFVPLAIALTSSPTVSESVNNSNKCNSSPPIQSGAGNEMGSSSGPNDVQLLFSCHRCRKQFCSVSALDAHVKTHKVKPRENIGHCEHCGKVYRTWKFFQKHCAACELNTNNNGENTSDKSSQLTNACANANSNSSAKPKPKPKKRKSRAGMGSKRSEAANHSRRENSKSTTSMSTGLSPPSVGVGFGQLETTSSTPALTASGSGSQKKTNTKTKSKEQTTFTNMYEPRADNLVSPAVFRNTGIQGEQLISMSPNIAANQVNSILSNTVLSSASSAAAASTTNTISSATPISKAPLSRSNEAVNEKRGKSRKADEEAVLVFNCKVCRLAFPSLDQCRQHIVTTHLAQVLETPMAPKSSIAQPPTVLQSPSSDSPKTNTANSSTNSNQSSSPIIAPLPTSTPISTAQNSPTPSPTSTPPSTPMPSIPPSAPPSSHPILPNIPPNFDLNLNSHLTSLNMNNPAYSLAPNLIPNLISNSNQTNALNSSLANTLIANLQIQNLPHLANLANILNFQNFSNISSNNPNLAISNLANFANLSQFQNLANLISTPFASAANSNLSTNSSHHHSHLHPHFADLAESLHLNTNYNFPPFSTIMPTSTQFMSGGGGESSSSEVRKTIGSSNVSSASGSGLGSPCAGNSNLNSNAKFKAKTNSTGQKRANAESKLKSLLLQDSPISQNQNEKEKESDFRNKDCTNNVNTNTAIVDGAARSSSRSLTPFSMNAAPSPENMYPYICLHCKRMGVTQGFGSDQEIHEHILKYHVTTIRFHCPFSFCQQVFLEQDAFEEHIVSDHQVPA